MAYLQGCYPLVGKEQLAAGVYSYTVSCPEIASQAKPGQFVHIRVDGFSLRRPISICGIDAENGLLRMVFEVRGRGTEALSLIVKLSPNVTDIAAIAQAVEAEGADAISLINTLLGMRIDIKTRRPVLKNNVGGLSGPAVFPVAVRMVWQVASAVKIPVVGMGGISCWQDAIEMMLAGARAVQIGAALFTDPYTPVRVIEGMDAWLEENGVSDVNEIVGAVRPW